MHDATPLALTAIVSGGHSHGSRWPVGFGGAGLGGGGGGSGAGGAGGGGLGGLGGPGGGGFGDGGVGGPAVHVEHAPVLLPQNLSSHSTSSPAPWCHSTRGARVRSNTNPLHRPTDISSASRGNAWVQMGMRGNTGNAQWAHTDSQAVHTRSRTKGHPISLAFQSIQQPLENVATEMCATLRNDILVSGTKRQSIPTHEDQYSHTRRPVFPHTKCRPDYLHRITKTARYVQLQSQEGEGLVRITPFEKRFFWLLLCFHSEIVNDSKSKGLLLKSLSLTACIASPCVTQCMEFSCRQKVRTIIGLKLCVTARGILQRTRVVATANGIPNERRCEFVCYPYLYAPD